MSNASPYGLLIDDNNSLFGSFINPTFPKAAPSTPAQYASAINFSSVKNSIPSHQQNKPTGDIHSVLSNGMSFSMPKPKQRTPSVSATAHIPFMNTIAEQSSIFATHMSYHQGGNSVSTINNNTLQSQHVNLLKNGHSAFSQQQKNDYHKLYESKIKHLEVQLKQQQFQLQADFEKKFQLQ